MEQANLLGALGWTLHQQDWARFVEYALVLDAYLDTQGDWEQDRLILGLALQACDALGGEYAGRAAVLQHNLAVIDMAQGRLAQPKHASSSALLFSIDSGTRWRCRGRYITREGSGPMPEIMHRLANALRKAWR